MRKITAGLLIIYGVLGLAVGLTDAVTGQERTFTLATMALNAGVGFGCGWLLCSRAGWRRISAVLLLSLAAFSCIMGLDETLTGAGGVAYEISGAARFSLPAIVCSWLLWQGRAIRQIGAVVVGSWALSFVVQAVAYSDGPMTAVVIIARAGVPGLICAWLLWRGGDLRQIAAVLLVSWPVSYLIYALRGEDLDSAIGELLIGVPTIIVGWLLWREHRAGASTPVAERTAAKMDEAQAP